MRWVATALLILVLVVLAGSTDIWRRQRIPTHEVASVSSTARSFDSQAAPSTESSGTSRSLICREGTFDSGAAGSEDILEHDFTLLNASDQTVTITDVRPSCGCTTADLASRQVGPGKSAVLHARMTLQGRYGPTQSQILVKVDGPDPALILTLKVVVANAAEALPSRLDYGDLGVGDTVDRDFSVVFPRFEGAHSILSYDVNPPGAVEIRQLDLGKAANLHVVKTRFLATTRAVDVNGSIKLSTDDGKAPIVEIPFSARVSEGAVVSPRAVVIEKGEATTRYISIRSIGKNPLDLEKIEAPPQVGVEIISAGAGKLILKFEISASAAMLPQSAAFVKFTNSPKPVRIPIYMSNSAPADRH